MHSILKKIDTTISHMEQHRQETIDLLERSGFPYVPKQDKPLSSAFALEIEQLSQLRMAAIMDRFTLESYAPECNLMEVTPENWQQEMEDFRPHLLFVESAWQGKEERWYRKIAHCSKEYFQLCSYCHKYNIPVVFWNKEDPVYADTFLAAARLADIVFTTDIDCIQIYKTQLGHNHVYHLHFAAQPELHNPIEAHTRKDKFCFAGAYYHRYQERAEVFDRFSELFIQGKGLDIYDRNYKNARPEHAFPRQYAPHILGRLDPTEIDVAYKGYTYGINMNSIHQSQTMFARRVFELLASNTVTVGNFSRGVKNYFGDLTISTNDTATLQDYLQRYCSDDTTRRKYRLLGLRKVLSGHLYYDRLAFVVERLFGVDFRWKEPLVNVVAKADTAKQAERVIQRFSAQKYQNKQLLIISDILQDNHWPEDTVLLSSEQAKERKTADLDGYCAVFHAGDFYGEHYLIDLLLCTRFSAFDAVGKSAYYDAEISGGASLSLREKERAYQRETAFSLRRAAVRAAVVSGVLYDLPEATITVANGFSADEFHYCKNHPSDCPDVCDLPVADQGIALSRMQEIGAKIAPQMIDPNALILEAEEIFQTIDPPESTAVSIQMQSASMALRSTMDADAHIYCYMQALYAVAEYSRAGALSLQLSGTGDLDLTVACVFYDKARKKIAADFCAVNQMAEMEPPKHAAFFQLGFRIKGSGSFAVERLVVGADYCKEESGCFLSRSNVLVLTNHYPSTTEIYRNMFVHSRVRAYREQGMPCDVMRMHVYADEEYREYQGINVVEGRAKKLADVLEYSGIDTVCVHFLDPHMWGVLRNYSHRMRIIVWVHGSEIQPWWRREYNYSKQQELVQAKKESERRQAFWDALFADIQQYHLHFVAVSQYFAKEIQEDYPAFPSKEHCTIIHNSIDTDVFQYKGKPPEQRKKLLSIRPYANRKYANDLTVKCILELSKRDFFDDLEFLIVGRGELFDSVLRPIKKMRNVQLVNTFLQQNEIAELYDEYGIFLTPTRMDAQGVSRDEAMASGLVPVTNSVAAIPEFVDEDCGILAPAEDYLAMADGVERLYRDPDLFARLSENAAKRVRKQSAKNITIAQELALIRQALPETAGRCPDPLEKLF